MINFCICCNSATSEERRGRGALCSTVAGAMQSTGPRGQSGCTAPPWHHRRRPYGDRLLSATGTALQLPAAPARGHHPAHLTDCMTLRWTGARRRHGVRARAFFDSVTDRVADAVLMGGVAWYLVGSTKSLGLLPLAVLGVSALVSYERAKAESLAFRPRAVDGAGGADDSAGDRLSRRLVPDPVLWVMLVLISMTGITRFVKVWNLASGKDVAVRRSVVRGRRQGRIALAHVARGCRHSRERWTRNGAPLGVEGAPPGGAQ